MSIGILGAGSYVPERAVTNVEIARHVPGATDEWITRRTAIRARRFAAPGEASFDVNVVCAGFVDKMLAGAGVRAAEVRHVVPHQANGVLLANLVERCGLAGATTHRTVEKYGNVGSAAIPVTLDEANRAGELADGDLVLLLGFGGGISMGACLLRWAAAPLGK